VKLSKTDYSKKVPGKYSREIGISFSQEDGSIGLFSKTYSGHTFQRYHFHKKELLTLTLKDCYINVKVKQKMEAIFTSFKTSHLQIMHYQDDDTKFYTSVEAHRFNVIDERTIYVDSPVFNTYSQNIDRIKSFREIELAVKDFIVNTDLTEFEKILKSGTKVAWSTVRLELKL